MIIDGVVNIICFDYLEFITIRWNDQQVFLCSSVYATNQTWFLINWNSLWNLLIGIWTQDLKLSLTRRARVLFTKVFDYFKLSGIAELGSAIKNILFQKLYWAFNCLNKLLEWSEFFCKFSAFSLERPNCFYIIQNIFSSQ